MVSIRLQRTGRRRHAQFRMVVQDSRRAPTSGRVVAVLGFYNPHTKEHKIDLEQALSYLNHGAQPSSRVVKFMLDQKLKLPAWVKQSSQRADKVKYPEKLRRNRPPEPVAEKKAPPAESTTSEDKPSPDAKSEAQTAKSKPADKKASKAVAKSEAEKQATTDEDANQNQSAPSAESLEEKASEVENAKAEEQAAQAPQADEVVKEEPTVDEKAEESAAAEDQS